ncbi:MAG: transporter [Bacteroidales bacterium]|nr:transporter [Bacteroidales bacterium]
MREIILLVGLLVAYCFSASAQCCSAGNPVDSDVNSGLLGKKTLVVGVSYKQSYSDTYYEGSSKSDYVYFKNSGFQFSSLNLSYGITPRLTVKAEMGYFFAKSQTFYYADYSRKSYGLADAELGLKYTAYRSKKGDFMVAGAFNLKIPVGEFDRKFDNVRLPIDIQPSSGSFRYHLGVLFYKSFSNNKWALYSYYAAEFAQRIQSERISDYKYGNFYISSYAVNYKISKKLSTSLQIRGELREKAVDKGLISESTGGYVFFVAPELSYSILKDWTASTNVNVPFYKNMNGTQLTNKFAFGVSIKKNIHF